MSEELAELIDILDNPLGCISSWKTGLITIRGIVKDLFNFFKSLLVILFTYPLKSSPVVLARLCKVGSLTE